MGNDMRVERTRGSLREALLAIMQEKPWRSVRVAEVTRVAGVSRKVFYDHYEDLFDLAFDCYDTCCLDYGESTPITDDESRRRATLNYVGCVTRELEFYRSNPNLAHMIYECTLTSPYLEKLVDKRIGVFRSYIEREKRSDVPFAIISEEETARCIFVANQYVVREWVGAGMQEPAERVARRMAYLGFLLADGFRFDERTSTEYIRATLDYVPSQDGRAREGTRAPD